MHFYDPVTGRARIKRRYVWGFWSFLLGAILGVMIMDLLL